jgi:hypothetical protein
MSNEMKAALIGLAGALFGALITYIATMRSTKRLLAAQKLQYDIDRAGKEQEPIVLFMADFLTEHAAYEASERHEVLSELDHQLERLVKSLHLKGHKQLASAVSNKGGDYLRALRLYARGGMSSKELDDCRIRTREEVREAISRFAGKG